MAETETIVLGGGCFWCIEAVFKEVKGVVNVTSGYAGGSKIDPTYEEVSSGRTGHAEVLQIEFNPSIVTLEEILKIFFEVHDPTTLNCQGADVGTQYRSIILYADEAQKKTADDFIDKLIQSKVFSKKIVTELKPLGQFYAAEGYHQDYFSKNRGAPYCQMVIQPKLEKFLKK
jgi:methionine-S-sulfoxide reductase